ncbi:MAG: hypothetical protein AAF228_13315 [Pseudomonadota bacterium]
MTYKTLSASLWFMRENILIPEELVQRAIKAGKETARYCEPDAGMWIEQAALAGIQLAVNDQGGIVTNFIDADFEVATFLDAWLHESPRALKAVEKLLKKRGAFKI